MTSSTCVFYLTCLFLGKMAESEFSFDHEENAFLSANVGESLTLLCFYKHDESSRTYWYKQNLGQKPRLISTLYAFDKTGTFYNEFQDNPRFTLDTEIGGNHLRIKDLNISDSATYFCARRALYTIEFAAGTTVSVKDSGFQALVHQSASEPIQPGVSVTLSCTVQTGSCDGKHSVYWFKNSEESPPGLIYSHGGRNDQCERNTSTQTHTCVYNLPIKSLKLSHAGTYYCAVASCGHILFGDGTKLDIKDNEDSLLLVNFLGGALAFSTILVVFLAHIVCRMYKKNSCQCKEPDSQARTSAASVPNTEDCQDDDSLHYAALQKNIANRGTKPRDNTRSECVYSSVRQ